MSGADRCTWNRKTFLCLFCFRFSWRRFLRLTPTSLWCWSWWLEASCLTGTHVHCACYSCRDADADLWWRNVHWIWIRYQCNPVQTEPRLTCVDRWNSLGSAPSRFSLGGVISWKLVSPGHSVPPERKLFQQAPPVVFTPQIQHVH